MDDLDALDATVTVGSTSRRSSAHVSGRLCVVVIGEGLDATHPLPDQGVVAIGRSPDSDIQIDNGSVSRNHALLRVGESITIEDLGSSNGTRMREHLLIAHVATTVALGEPIDVGSVMIVVQARNITQRQRQIWAHGYFEARVDEECARAQRSDAAFAVLRVHSRGVDTGRAVEQCLIRELRGMDVIGYYGPSEYEALIVDVQPVQAGVVVDKLNASLGAAGVDARIGIALYPRDARNPYELMSRASAAALGQRLPTDGTPVMVANAAVQHLDKIVHRIAAGTISVLVMGETGVGKEVLSERIHKLSKRATKPFLRLNCAALSESLLESELFGHEKGSFTGAIQTKPGLLETADAGTVFLDEIGELPMAIQVKLLRVIEERQVLRVGALKSRHIDVRFVSATNRDLEAEIERGKFRQDLYFRLNGVTLVIPPLRERISEIPDLVHAFLRHAADRDGIPFPGGVSPEAYAVLRAYSWPGNIRELRNVIERALLLSGGGVIDVEHLPTEKMRANRVVEAPPTSVASPTPPAPVVPEPEAPAAPASGLQSPGRGGAITRDDIIDALARAGGNQTEAAKLIGVSRRTFINRVIEFDVPRPRKK